MKLKPDDAAKPTDKRDGNGASDPGQTLLRKDSPAPGGRRLVPTPEDFRNQPTVMVHGNGSYTTDCGEAGQIHFVRQGDRVTVRCDFNTDAQGVAFFPVDKDAPPCGCLVCRTERARAQRPN